MTLKIPIAQELRDFITLRSMTITRGADGSVIETPATFARVWARIIPLSGSEDYVAQGITATTVYEVWIRYLDGVIPQMDFTFGDRQFDIRSVRDYNERHRWMILTAVEGDKV